MKSICGTCGYCRHIQFRAIKDDQSDQNFIFGMLTYRDGIPRIHFNDQPGLYVTCIPGTEGQSSGVTDDSGAMLYEGDIIENDAGKWEVVFSQGCFVSRLLNGEPFNPDKLYLALRAIRGKRLLGNKHHNPALLTCKEN